MVFGISRQSSMLFLHRTDPVIADFADDVGMMFDTLSRHYRGLQLVRP